MKSESLTTCLLTGATGYIGSAVHRELTEAGWRVLALCRSDAVAQNLAAAGSIPVLGDLRTAAKWLPDLGEIDAVVHTACGFIDTMADDEREFLAAIIENAAPRPRPLRFIYTGGCWLYGPTHNRPAREGDPFNPPRAWTWMERHRAMLLENGGLDVVVIHPAMVWDEVGGAIAPFIEAAERGEAPTVVGSPDTLWSFVHRSDLADLYRRTLTAASPSTDYNAACDAGLKVGDVARAIARRHGSSVDREPIISGKRETMAQMGDWAEGFAVSQELSGDLARNELGWRPRHLLARTLDLP